VICLNLITLITEYSLDDGVPDVIVWNVVVSAVCPGCISSLLLNIIVVNAVVLPTFVLWVSCPFDWKRTRTWNEPNIMIFLQQSRPTKMISVLPLWIIHRKSRNLS